MKSDRRHELEKNILADHLGEGIQAARPVLPIVLGGLAIAAVGLIAWGAYSASTRNRAATAWTEYYFNLTSNDADAFVDVAEEFSASKAALWAQQTAGSSYLERGVEALYRNRAEGEKLLNQAIEAFEMASTSGNTDLSTKAHYGLGQAHEALGQLDEATEHFEKVIDSNTYAAMIDSAKRRLAFISSTEGRSFYAWFNKLDPKPNAPIQLPDNLSMPPTSPGDLKFDPISGGAAFQLPQTGADNPDAPPQAVEVDPNNVPDLPATETPGSLPPSTELPTDLPETPGTATDGDFPDLGEPAPSNGIPQPPTSTDNPTSTENPAADETPAGGSDQ